MRVAFRVDATAEIGTGHLMRSIALADELARRGADVAFISRGLPTHLGNLLNDRGFALIPLRGAAALGGHDELPHSKWLGRTQAQDLQETVLSIGQAAFDWIVVDH